MTWRTLTCYDSRAVTVQSFSSAVGLLLHGLAGPFATGARGQESGGGGGGGRAWGKPRRHRWHGLSLAPALLQTIAVEKTADKWCHNEVRSVHTCGRQGLFC